MNSLARTTEDLRKWLKYAAIGLVVLLVAILIIRGLLYVKNILFPKAPPPPKQEYGLLPPSITNFSESSNIQYRINTVDGSLPLLQDRVNIYVLEKSKPNFLSLDNAKSKLRQADFKSEPTKISDTTYQWTEENTGASIQYNIINQNFTISSDYTSNPDLESTSLLPDPSSIQEDVKRFLNSIGESTDDIDFKDSKVTYYELRDGRLVEAQNLGSAKFAKVDLTQSPINDLPFTYTHPDESILNFVVSYSKSSMQVLEAEFYHHRAKKEQKSDYLIKTVNKAFEDLQSGKAEIFNSEGKGVVDITDVKLKYYLDKNTELYLQPVFVFTGIDFTAYVDAIPDISLRNN